jgi:septum formation protein
MLRNSLLNLNLILASGSPRRQQFFKDLDLDFIIRIKEVDEVYPEHLQREEITDYLAILKVDAQKKDLASNELLVTSDTIVWLEGEAIGKPKDYNDAFTMLQKLSNKTHEVITSVCFCRYKKINVINDVTKVTFTELSDEMIEYYITNFKPYDKAGAYGIQDWIGLVGVKSIEGSYTNVMGLPTEKVFAYLKNLQANSLI